MNAEVTDFLRSRCPRNRGKEPWGTDRELGAVTKYRGAAVTYGQVADALKEIGHEERKSKKKVEWGEENTSKGEPDLVSTYLRNHSLKT